MLYPSEQLNEKLLIRIRDCLLHLKSDHPLKRWIKSLSMQSRPTAEEQVNIEFIQELIDSPFNLVTDQKIRTKIILQISKIPKDGVLNKLLKSYLYLMVGNMTRSDNLLRELIRISPKSWFLQGQESLSIYEETTQKGIDKIFKKMSRHPADRTSFQLFLTYLKNYTNDSVLRDLVEDYYSLEKNSKIHLGYTRRIAPELTRSIDIISSVKPLETNQEEVAFLSEWVWPFYIGSFYLDESKLNYLYELERTDLAWLVFLMNNERIADAYIKKFQSNPLRKMELVKGQLSQRNHFMLNLFNLIEHGAIDLEIVDIVSKRILHE